MRAFKPPKKRVFTLVLSDKKYEDGQPLHCINCGQLLMMIYSDIKTVTDHAIKQEDAGEKRIVLRCKNCKSDLTIL